MRKIIIYLGMCCFLFLAVSCKSEELNPAQIMDKYGDAVVLITTINNNEEIGLGSGFIVKSDGVIVTNYHVIEGAYPAIVKLKNGDVYEDISVIDYNERKDVAVIKVKGFDLPTVIVGNSNDARVGEKIVVIGNPRGLDNSISDGLLSQIRDTENGFKLFQISAPISPGSSGSPVFEMNGEVISIASSGFSSEYGQNLNFSVPINYVRGMIAEPVKWTLKDFSEREKEKTFLGKSENKEKINNEEFLKRINDAINCHIYSNDLLCEGADETEKPHKNKFKPNKFFISNKIYKANEITKIAYIDLREIETSDEELEGFKIKILSGLKEMNQGTRGVLDAFEHKQVNAFGVYFSAPEWQKARTAGTQCNLSFRKLDKKFLVQFVDRVKKEAPALENEFLPTLVSAYNNRDKSEEEIVQQYKQYGKIGVIFRYSSRLPIIILVNKNGPAEKAGIKKDDIILGVVDGMEFKTQMDYSAFQKTTKPGEKYKFKIERENKTLTKTITMN